MAVIVDTFTTDLRTYEVSSSIDNGTTWISKVTGATLPWTDADGEMRNTLYRVRDDTDGVGNESPWTPSFFGYPDDINYCRISGYIKKPNGDPKQDSVLQVLIAKNYTYNQNYFISSRHDDRYEVLSDINGYWEIDLPRNIRLTVRIPDLGIERIITTPNESSATLDSIL